MSVSKVVCEHDTATAADVLTCAAEILDAEGWRRNEWGSYCGPKCADGALIAATIHLVGLDSTMQEDTTLVNPESVLTVEGLDIYHEARQALAMDLLVGDPLKDPRTISRTSWGFSPVNIITRWNDQEQRRKRDKRKIMRRMVRVARKLRAAS